MCGILGISVQVDNKSELTMELKTKFSLKFDDSLSLLSHRGPDSNGSQMHFERGVFLGHTRLSIQDLTPTGAQPMDSIDQRYSIIFNGEIYNFPTLKKRLIEQGCDFVTHTDTEVILSLYAEHGLDMFSLLDGIFALAIFDKKREELIIARDGLGVKPLYYYTDSKVFSFSSEIKALEKLLEGSSLTLDPNSINRYLTFQWCPGEGTPYKEIKKQGPGEIFVVKNGQIIDKKVFYRLPITKSVKKKILTNVDEVVNELDRNLRKAVHDQMLSDAPLGAFLSGGLDSTSVVAFAKEVNPEIMCFTIDTQSSANDGMQDDLPFARDAANFLKVPLEIVTVDSQTLVQNLEKMVWTLDEPLGDPAPLNVLYISELARENGIKVLLSGAGGDDIFTGYRRHQAIMYDDKIQMIPRSILSVLEQTTGRLDKRVTLFRRLAKLFSGSLLTGGDRIVNYFRWIDRADLFQLYSDEFRAEIAADLAEQPMLEFLSTANTASSVLDKMLGLEQRFFTTDHNLIYTDKMSMAAGVEVRVPLLARHLVEFASTIPDQMKQKGSVGKWIFKKTMEPYLPNEIIYRPKTGFGAPMREWLKHELREYVEDLLSQKSLSSRGLFNTDGVQKLLIDSNSGKIDASYTIFSLMCIELWCRQHLDSSPIITQVPSERT